MGNRNTEAMLVVGLRQGDSNAFEQLYRRYYKALLGLISRIVGDPMEAQDVLQDTYVKVWQRFHYYDSQQGALYTWLVHIARNTALDALSRRRLVCLPSSEVAMLSADLSSWPVIDTIGVKDVVQRVLTTQQWQVLDLAYWQGYSRAEIAKSLGLPIGTVKTKLRQSLLQLRPYFDVGGKNCPT